MSDDGTKDYRGPTVSRANEGRTWSQPPTRRDLAEHAQSYGGKRDLYDALGYDKTGDLTFRVFWGRYLRDGVATALIDRFVESTWQDYPVVTDGSTGDIDDESDPTPTSQFETDVDDLLSGNSLRQPTGTSLRQSVSEAIEMADKYATVGSYSLLFLAFTDGDTDLSDPVGRRSMSGSDVDEVASLAYVRPLTEAQVSDIDRVDDRNDPRHNLPATYEIQFDTDDGTENVHHERIIHIPEGTRTSPTQGTPALLRGWNRFDDIEKLLGGSAEQAWRGAYQGMVIQPPRDEDGRIIRFKDGDDEIDKQIAEYRHNMRRAIKSTGEITTLDANIADVSNNIEMQFRAIAAAYGIPQSILMGNETGERATTEDKNDFSETIASRRNRHAEQRILRPLIDRLVYVGSLPEPEGDSFEFHWTSLSELSEQDWADLMKTKSEAIDLLSGGMPDRMFSLEERRTILGYPEERGSLSDSTTDDESDMSDPAEDIDEAQSLDLDEMTTPAGSQNNGESQA